MVFPPFRTLLFALTCGIGLVASATIVDPRQSGTPILRVWTAESYGAAPVNWQSLQDPGSGLIYVANNFGVLEFDGALWRFLALPNEGRARCLALDGAGRLWAAGDDIVRFSPDADGVLRAVSQVDRLPAEQRNVGSIGFGAASSEVVAFASPRTLFVFPTERPAFTVEATAAITSVWVLDDEIHVSLSGGEVKVLRGRELVAARFTLEIEGAKVGKNRTVDGVTRLPDGSWRFATNRGLLQVAPGASSATLVIAAEEVAGDDQITASALLADGRFACATPRQGLLIFDSRGALVQRINRQHGLPGNRIDHLFEDREGGLWLAHRTGLSRIQLDSPFAIHGPAQGLDGGPRALLRHEGKLYVAHHEGLSVLQPEGRFVAVPGLPTGGNRLLGVDGRLLVTSGSIRELSPDGTMRLLLRQAFQPLIASARDSASFLGGATTGLYLLRREADRLVNLGRVAGVPAPVSHVLDTADGYVWTVDPNGTVSRIDFRAGLRLDAAVRVYTVADGLQAVRRRDEPVLFTLGGTVLWSSAQGLLRHDAATDRFVPEDRLTGLDPTRVGGTDVSFDQAGHVWLRLGPPRREFVRLLPEGPQRWRAEVMPAAPLSSLVSNSIYADLPAQTVWVAGQGALISMQLGWQPARPSPALRVAVRRMITRERVLAPSGGAAPPVFPPKTDSLRIEFSAPSYQPDHLGQIRTMYRTRLLGLHDAWSDWSPDPHRDFTNLPYRQLVFQVQARDLAGRESEIAQLAFEVRPPWTLRPPALMAYLALLAGLVTLIVRLRTRALQRRNAELTAAVAARTGELNAQNHELARLHRLELDEKTAARLAEEKARLEVLRYQLNPHFLFNTLNAICAHIVRDPVAARAMVVQLGEFCRLTLHRPDDEEEVMTVAQELKLLRAYLDIEQVRLGSLLAVEIEADRSADFLRLPPFLLLPLVENAVKYGAASSPEQLRIRLTVRRGPGDQLHIEVANTGAWLPPGAHSAPSHGIGLENLRQRLLRYYPGAHEFTTHAADGWVVMRLHLLAPLHEHPRAAH